MRPAHGLLLAKNCWYVIEPGLGINYQYTLVRKPANVFCSDPGSAEFLKAGIAQRIIRVECNQCFRASDGLRISGEMGRYRKVHFHRAIDPARACRKPHPKRLRTSRQQHLLDV